MKLLQEFREFAAKGNVLDMAIGILIGVAFNNIVNSLVNDILMPPLGMALGGAEFKDLKLVLREGAADASGTPIAEVAIRYGAFVNALVEFLIIALSAFVVIKVMNRVMRGREQGEEG